MDLLSGLLAAKEILKMWHEKGFGWLQTNYCFFKNGRLFFAISFAYLAKLLDFSIDTEYKIVASMSDICYSDVAFFYIGSIVVGGWRTVLKNNTPTARRLFYWEMFDITMSRQNEMRS